MAVLQAGHAAAAAAEGVPLHHAAVFLALLLPGAWVALEEGALAALAPRRLLRVHPTPRPLPNPDACMVVQESIHTHHALPPLEPTLAASAPTSGAAQSI